MESQKSFTLPHIELIVNELLLVFAPLNASDAASAVVAEVSIRSALYSSIQKRLVRRLQCDDSPSIAAALLYPGYHNSLMRLELGVSQEAVKSSSAFLVSWLWSYVPLEKDDNDVDEMVVDPQFLAFSLTH